MGLFQRWFGGARRAREYAREHCADLQSFFYVREWACQIGRGRDELVATLGLTAPRPTTFRDGVWAVDTQRDHVLVTEFGGATFVFGHKFRVFESGERLSRPSGVAYVVFVDDKRYNISCRRYEHGQLVRELTYAEGEVTEVGERDPREPVVSNTVEQIDVLELASVWGPDPRELVRAAPASWLYTMAG
jgi:hypothetical protein